MLLMIIFSASMEDCNFASKIERIMEKKRNPDILQMQTPLSR